MESAPFAEVTFDPWFWYLGFGVMILLTTFWYAKKLGYMGGLKERVKRSSGSSGGNVPFAEDMTMMAESGDLDPVIGREDEISRVIHILSRRNKNNPVLLGPAGVGKTAIVEGLAYKIATGDVPTGLADKKVWALQVSDLLSGTKYRGEFEKRIQQLLAHVEQANRQVVLFVDEIHTLVQTKGTEGAVNFTDIIKPALSRGDLQLIGATTLKEYEQYIMPDEPLERRLQVVMVDEPDVEDAIKILQGVKGHYEDYHSVTIDEAAVTASVRLSHEYIKNRRLPDKAIDLIDEASATVKVRESSAPESAVALLHDASYQARCKFDDCPKELMKLKEELAKLRQKQKEELSPAELKQVKRDMVKSVKEIEKIEKELQKKDGRPHVTEKDIKRIVAAWARVAQKDIH